MKTDVAIIGGGLAGLTAAIRLSGAGHSVTVLEKGQYPRHKVCGEYVSLEVKPLLEALHAFPAELQPVYIDRLLLTASGGGRLRARLPVGAFSLSRYAFDHFLCERARDQGAEVQEREMVDALEGQPGAFRLRTRKGKVFEARVVICCQGKRSLLDRQLGRPGADGGKSPWMGVKYHMAWEMPGNEVQLHHFPMGYCGLSRIESGLVNVCYLVHRDQLGRAGDLPSLEQRYLGANPALRAALTEGIRQWERPVTISNVSFARRGPVSGGFPFSGDAAGLISPLCGNGMAMAILSGNQVGLLAHQHLSGGLAYEAFLHRYRQYWRREFATRLRWGRWLQNLFWRPYLMDRLVRIGAGRPAMVERVISFTHGKRSLTKAVS